MQNVPVKTVKLKMGELSISDKPIIIDTVLNSPCVAVCVFIPETDLGGMVHFAMPKAPATVDPKAQYNYGNLAVKGLVEGLMKISGKPASSFVAKMVGGAKNPNSRNSKFDTGADNVRSAKDVLSKYGIKVVGEDVGGESDRRALFHCSGGRLQVAPLEALTTVTMPTSNHQASTTSAATNPTAKVDDRKRKVLIVDDSKTIRDLLVRILSEDSQLEIIGTATNPIEAQEMLKTKTPDVITLDIHMPEMTGVEWLEKLLPKMAVPVVMITSLQLQDGNEVFKALELGAVDYIQKPVLNEIKEMAPIIREKVKSASFAKVKVKSSRRTVAAPGTQVATGAFDQNTLIAMGASTGGTEALKDVLIRLPQDIPPIVIVQHIPAVFSKAFADRLNGLCPFEVLEASDGDLVIPGRVLIAPGGKQMKLERLRSGELVTRITDDAPMNRHKPSVDYLFYSVAEVLGGKCLGVILTGMGADGAQGLLKLRQAGARTLGQDEESCVVYGMPRAAFLCGAVEEVHTLDDMASAMASGGNKKAVKKKIA